MYSGIKNASYERISNVHMYVVSIINRFFASPDDRYRSMISERSLRLERQCSPARDRNGYRYVPLKSSNNLITFQSIGGQYELALHNDHLLMNIVASSHERLSRCKSPRQVSIVLHNSFPGEEIGGQGLSRVPRISSNCFTPITSDTTDNAASRALPVSELPDRRR